MTENIRKSSFALRPRLERPPRRQFLVGLTPLLALPLIGCDGETSSDAKPSSDAPKSNDESDKADAEAKDIELLNTGIALEQGAILVYQAAAGLPFIAEDDKVLAVAKLFMGHHTEHRDTLAKMVEQFGGSPTDPKTVTMPDLPPTITDEAAEADARKLATLKFARSLERRAADTYFQLIVQQLRTDAAKRGATEILPVEAQHVAVYDTVLGEAAPVNAAFFTSQS